MMKWCYTGAGELQCLALYRVCCPLCGMEALLRPAQLQVQAQAPWHAVHGQHAGMCSLKSWNWSCDPELYM